MNRLPDTPQDCSDLQLDRLLHQLAKAQPSAGLNERLLRSLADREAVVSAPRPSSVPFFRHRTRLWAALLTPSAFAALIVFFWLPSHHAQLRTPSKAAGVQRQAAPRLASPGSLAHDVISSRDQAPALARHQARLSSTPRLATPGGTAQQARVAAEETQALDDLHAPSQPAPLMPLTAQERLLTSMVRKDNGQQLAQLAPDPAQIVPGGEKAAFQRFFDPPPVPQPEDPSPATPSAPTPSPLQGKVQ